MAGKRDCVVIFHLKFRSPLPGVTEDCASHVKKGCSFSLQAQSEEGAIGRTVEVKIKKNWTQEKTYVDEYLRARRAVSASASRGWYLGLRSAKL
jgi:hypothetical protein